MIFFFFLIIVHWLYFWDDWCAKFEASLVFLSSSYQLFCLQIIELIINIISCSPKFRVTSCKKYKSGSTFSGKTHVFWTHSFWTTHKPCITELLMGGNVSSVDECYFSLKSLYSPCCFWCLFWQRWMFLHLFVMLYDCNWLLSVAGNNQH